jgi:hypothetical protein
MRLVQVLAATLAAVSLCGLDSAAVAGPGGLPGGGCHRDYRPVCGVDHHTYPNACVATHAGVPIAYRGRCRPILCPMIYRPVCGVDHRTYANACQARARGVAVAYPGRCGPYRPRD